MTQATVNGNAYSDDGSAARDMRNGGHKLWLIPLAGDIQAVGTAAQTSASQAATSASQAASSAANLIGTSSSSVAIGTGSKSFTASTGRQWAVGGWLCVMDTANPTVNAMWGKCTAYNSGNGALTVDVDATIGAGTIAAWTIIVAGKTGAQGPTGSPGASGAVLTRLALSVNTTLGASDNAKLVDCTGSFTLTLAAPGTLAANWWTYVRNVGSGEITLSHTSGNIDGLAAYKVYPGEARLVQCDGSTIRTMVVTPYCATFTSSGTWTKPPGYAAHGGKLWGGGGGGAKGSGAPGGGGGSCAEFVFPSSAYGATETVTIGAGGAGSTTGTPTAGGDSTLGSLVRANGGRAATTDNGGTAYAASNSTFGSSISTVSGSGPSIYGGNRGNDATYLTVHGGGGGAKEAGTASPTVFGGGGGAAGTTGVGSDGTAPAGGGGATNTGATGGAGARGELRIWGVC